MKREKGHHSLTAGSSINFKSRSLPQLWMAVLCLFLFFSATLWAQETGGSNLVQITSHPSEDLSPRLSPDGKWLAFVSKRSGNYDIWLKNMQSGFSRRLTKHRADDFYPIWDQKQRYLVYVSQQSDAHGDLYRLNLRDVGGELIPKGEPERLTFYMGFDGYPAMSKKDENIAWVSDRTGRPEIWLQTKRRKNVRQLTHGGATHPAWSPNQGYLAFTSFRDDGCNGDIWLINLYAPAELFDRETPTDSLERPMWPVTKGAAVDGFPAWSDDANTLLFSRYDYDTNGDGRLSPADQSVLWSVKVSHLPIDSVRISTPSFEMFRESFDERIALNARPVTPTYYDARQASWNRDGTTYFVSPIKGNEDVWSFENPYFFTLPDSLDKLEYSDQNFPLPKHLTSRQLDSLSAIQANLTLSEKHMLWDRLTALHQIIDADSVDSIQQAQALYEGGMCLSLLGFDARAAAYFDYIISAFPQATEQVAWAELVRETQKAFPPQSTFNDVLDILTQTIPTMQLNYSSENEFLAQTDILLGNVAAQLKETEQAARYYRRVKERYPQFRNYCAQSLYALGVLNESGDEQAAFDAFLAVLQDYPDEEVWAVRARNRLLALSVQNARTDRERVELYKQFHSRLQAFDTLSLEPLFRAASLLTDMAQYNDAFALYDSIIVHYSNLPVQVAVARLRRAELLRQTGEFVGAAAAFRELADEYKTTFPEIAQQATDQLVDLLLSSADDLKRSESWSIALVRYQSVLEIAPYNIKAHQGYIESLFHLGTPARAVQEYELLVKEHPNNNILLYALGLAYSFRGTPQRDNIFLPSDVLSDDLERSNSILRNALSYDYNLIEAYLGLSYNYEMLENHLRWEKNRPRSFWYKAGSAIIGPLVWLYNTATFYDETKAPRYYENSIQVLTSALSLNDESKRPDLEALIALNMANNYYNVGEFGFSKAYEFYHLRMQYDSTFVNPYQEALILERMGHCAMVVGDAERGPGYLQRTIELYKERRDQDRVLINTKRLALLYEFTENSQQALLAYEKAAEMESRRRLYDGLLRSYRSLAYHHYLLNHQDQAVFYANKGLALLDEGVLQRSEGKPLFPQLGVLGIYIPVPFDLRRIGAKSALQLTTDEEEAILYSILASTFQDEQQYLKAISFFQKKLEIYQQRFDYEAQAIFKNNIGYLYFLQGDYEQAWYEMTESYWFAQKKLKNIGIQILDMVNAGHALVTMAHEPDESKRLKIPIRRDWFLREAGRVLKKSDSNPSLYAQGRMHIYILLADVMLIDAGQPESKDTEAGLTASYQRMQNAAKAEAYLREALVIAKSKGYIDDECAIRLKLGNTLQVLGFWDDAIQELIQCRALANQHQDFDVLWRVNTALGQTLKKIQQQEPENYKYQQQPLFYFQQAARLSEIHDKQMPGLSAARRRELLQEPYREIIRIYVEQGLFDEALKRAERMRERHYVELLHESDIHFGGRRQELFVIADSLQHKIVDIEGALQLNANAALQQQLRQLQIDFDDVLQTIRHEAPELEACLKISPVDVNTVQPQLPDSLTLLYHIAFDEQSFFWSITRDSVVFNSVPMKKKETLDLLTKDQVPESFKDVLRSITPDSRIVFIPDYNFMMFPWSRLTALLQDLPQITTVSSGLTCFSQALNNNRSRGINLYMATTDSTHFQVPHYTILNPVPQQSGDAFSAQRPLLSEADIIHLDVWADWNWMTPTLSSLRFDILDSQPATLSVSDLYSLNSSASHLSLNILNGTPPDPDDFITWERAAIFSGVSTFSLTSAAALDSTGTFYQKLYQGMSDRLTDIVFQDALKVLDNSGNNFRLAQLYGSIDLNDSEKQELLVLGASTLKNRADAAYQHREWDTALQLYTQLAATTPTDELFEKRLSCALNNNQWDAAVILLQNRIVSQERLNNWSAVADANRQLVVLYEYQSRANESQRARAAYQQLVREYGFEYDVAEAWKNLAALFQGGGSYRIAIDFYARAAETFARQNNNIGQLEALQDLANIYADHLRNIKQAVDAFDNAIKVAAHAQQSHIKAGLWLDRAQVCYEYSLLPMAHHSSQQARAIADELQDNALQIQGDVLLAKIYFALGDLSSAVKLVQAVPDSLSPETCDALLLRSRFLAERNEIDQAISIAKRASDIADHLKNKKLQTTAYFHLTTLYWYQGDFSSALTMTERIIDLDIELAARAHLLSAAILLDMGEMDRADQQLHFAQTVLQKFQNAADRVYYDYLSIHILNNPETPYVAERAAALADSLGWTWRAEWARAQHAVAQNNVDAAEYYDLALIKLKRSQPVTRFEDYQHGFSSSEEQFIQDLVNYNIQQGKINSALNVVEIASRRFQNRFNFWNRNSLFANEQEFAALDSLSQDLALTRSTLLLQKNNGDQNADVLMNKLVDLQNQLWRVRHSEFSNRPNTLSIEDSVNVQQLAATVPNDMLVVRTFYDQDNLHYWLVSQDSIYYIHSPMDVDSLHQKIIELNFALNEREPVEEQAAALYNMLIAAIGDRVASKDRVVMFPYGMLSTVPFALLAPLNGEPLGLDKQLLFARHLPISFQTKDGPIHAVAAINSEQNQRASLTYAQNATNSMQRYFPHLSIYAKDNFIEIDSVHSMTNYDAVYLGLDVMFQPNFPFGADIAPPFLAQNNTAVFREWLSELQTSVLVFHSLSPVDVNVTPEHQIFYDNMLSQTAETILAPQWQPDELAGAVLLKRFFYYLSEGQSCGEALRLAQKAVHDHVDAHPSAWAAYRLYGDF